MYGAFSFLHSQRMFLFGGETGSGCNNRTFIFYTNIEIWNEYSFINAPPCRSFGSLIENGEGEYILFGGKNGKVVYSDMWKYKIYRNEWTEIEIHVNSLISPENQDKFI